MKFKLVGIGELLWDLLPGGRQMGGAPANFACHACMLGADSRVISRVGNDAAGRDLIAALEKLDVPTDGIELDSAAPTGTVSVELAPDGQPHFTIHENVAWDFIRGEAAGRAAVSEADAVCFGTLAQRSETSRDTIRSLLAASRSTALRILDVNFRQNYFSRQLLEESLGFANVLKINDVELPRIAEMFRLPGDEIAQLTQLARLFNLRAVACTRGRDGSVLLANGELSVQPGLHAQVVDTVGAGDAFTAAMTIGLLAAWPIAEVNQRANEVAAFVCSHAGATPSLPVHLREQFRSGRLAPPSSQSPAKRNSAPE